MTTPTPSFDDWYGLVLTMHGADRNTAIGATRMAHPIFLQRDQLAAEVVQLRRLCVSLRHQIDGILMPGSAHDPDHGVERKADEARTD